MICYYYQFVFYIIISVACQGSLTETLVYQFSEERVQGEPQSHGTPLPAGDGLHTVRILPS